jgi:hypothetical protein
MLVGKANALQFSDVAGHWAENYITELTNAGIINGYSDGTYKPNGTIKRGEFLKLIMTATISDKDWSLPNYTYNHWSSIYSETAENKGIVEIGYADEQNADKEISRIDVAVILAKCDIFLRNRNQESKKLTFSDINDLDSEEVIFLKHCFSSEYINGYPEGTFLPNNTLTRAEVAKILSVYRNKK